MNFGHMEVYLRGSSISDNKTLYSLFPPILHRIEQHPPCGYRKLALAANAHEASYDITLLKHNFILLFASRLACF